jgi:hypothetical protein
MRMLEEESVNNSFYFGYLTVLDFSIYEIVNYFRLLFPTEINKFVKLTQIRDRVGSLPAIKRYEESEKGVCEYCPIRFFKSFKEEKIRESR